MNDKRPIDVMILLIRLGLAYVIFANVWPIYQAGDAGFLYAGELFQEVISNLGVTIPLSIDAFFMGKLVVYSQIAAAGLFAIGFMSSLVSFFIFISLLAQILAFSSNNADFFLNEFFINVLQSSFLVFVNAFVLIFIGDGKISLSGLIYFVYSFIGNQKGLIKENTPEEISFHQFDSVSTVSQPTINEPQNSVVENTKPEDVIIDEQITESINEPEVKQDNEYKSFIEENKTQTETKFEEISKSELVTPVQQENIDFAIFESQKNSPAIDEIKTNNELFEAKKNDANIDIQKQPDETLAIASSEIKDEIIPINNDLSLAKEISPDIKETMIVSSPETMKIPTIEIEQPKIIEPAVIAEPIISDEPKTSQDIAPESQDLIQQPELVESNSFVDQIIDVKQPISSELLDNNTDLIKQDDVLVQPIAQEVLSPTKEMTVIEKPVFEQVQPDHSQNSLMSEEQKNELISEKPIMQSEIVSYNETSADYLSKAQQFIEQIQEEPIEEIVPETVFSVEELPKQVQLYSPYAPIPEDLKTEPQEIVEPKNIQTEIIKQENISPQITQPSASVNQIQEPLIEKQIINENLNPIQNIEGQKKTRFKLTPKKTVS